MLASGVSAAYACDVLKRKGAKSIKFICILSCSEGVEYFSSKHPDIDIFTACMDEKLNNKKYILPGLGDAGDRIFGTF
jgi:uracil phosphoribosyltransferase